MLEFHLKRIHLGNVCVKLNYDKPYIFYIYLFIFIVLYCLEFRYGRKNTYFPCWLAVIITVLGSSFVQHFWIFFIMRFVIGVFCGGCLPLLPKS